MAPSVKGRRGLALLLVTGILGILAVLGAAFLTLARLERRASDQRVLGSKARLLARSGLEDAAARVSLGQAPSYEGEDWDADGTLSAFEAPEEAVQPGVLNVADCPPAQAMRPSFFARVLPSPNPALASVGGRLRGASGVLAEGGYALKAEDGNARIHVNGGSLGAARCSDVSADGPNGFLVRLLDNLDTVLTGAPGLGTQVVGARPPGGYRALEELKSVLTPQRYTLFRPRLSVLAWVDPQVVRPQPMEARPLRWMDVDGVHKDGTAGDSLAGTVPSWSITGSGTRTSPWTQSLTNSGGDGLTYPVRWERDFVYAWRQLRPGPVAIEPRAPLALNGAPREVLAAALLGLRGTCLEVWDGAAGFDGGFGWLNGSANTYPYPSQAADETPWIRTRLDYGMPYGPLPAPLSGTDGNPRTWYGPSGYDPTYTSGVMGGRPVIQSAPLGRLRESAPISRDQALALADEVLRYRAQAGPFRTWEQFDRFVERLPRWEDWNPDSDADGTVDPVPVLDGPAYTVTSATSYARRRYEREDANSDGVMNREVFVLASGGWAGMNPAWIDRGTAALASGDVPGLTFVQKDVIRAMANPNTDLNDLNPDANLFKEVDKTDLAGIPELPGSWSHTTEFCLDSPGILRVESAGRLLDGAGRLRASQAAWGVMRLWILKRHTTQADFMQDFLAGAPVSSVFSGAAAPYPVAGGQALVSYPEPQAVSPSAAYDGQIGLGGVATLQASPDETLRGDLFGSTLAATGDASVADVRGPSLLGLVGSAEPGNLFPDGVYSEKDAALKYPMSGNFSPPNGLLNSWVFYIGCWVKPHWFPEASPRPHALISLAAAQPWGVMPITGVPLCSFRVPSATTNRVPLEAIPLSPLGLFFIPARNNLSQSSVNAYIHASGGQGEDWPTRSLLWGATHSVFISETLNRRGVLNGSGDWNAAPSNPLPAVAKPVGRLEGHRWTHVAVMCETSTLAGIKPGKLVLGRTLGSPDGGGWNNKLHAGGVKALTLNHTSPWASEANHLRFGETAAAHNMNYVADATFADVQVGGKLLPQAGDHTLGYLAFFTGASGPGATGRYYKEGGRAAVFTSPRFAADGSRPFRITWTEVSCDLWFDGDNGGGSQDGWMGDAVNGYAPRNDQFRAGGTAGTDGLRDVRIEIEVWDDAGTNATADDVLLGTFLRASDPNALPPAAGRLYYRARFANDWDATTRANNPLDVTPFLDDVTVSCRPAAGVEVLAWGWEDAS